MAEPFKDHVPIPEELAGNSVGHCYMGGDNLVPGDAKTIIPVKRPLIFKDETPDGHSQ